MQVLCHQTIPYFESMIKAVLRSHLSRYPALQLQDLYKLLHQGALGSEHAVSDPESARKWLTREMAGMGDGPAEPLVDSISADGGIARIHLRPYLAAGLDPELLLSAFLRTAQEYHGDVRLIETGWRIAVGMTDFPAQEADEFIRSMKEKSHPAVHHSPEYEDLYRPAYRVVATAFCPGAWLEFDSI